MSFFVKHLYKETVNPVNYLREEENHRGNWDILMSPHKIATAIASVMA